MQSGAAKLPDDLREVFDLLWYQEMLQSEAAAILGISVPTVKLRWMKARHVPARAHRSDGERDPERWQALRLALAPCGREAADALRQAVGLLPARDAHVVAEPRLR